MLRHRLILGPLMLAALLAVLYLDDRLDRIAIEGTWLATLLLGRTHLPPGLLLLGALLLLIALGSRELARIFRAKGIDTPAPLLAVGAALALTLIYALPLEMNAQMAVALYMSLLAAVFFTALIWHCRHARTEGAVAMGAAVMLALLYVGTLPGFFMAIRHWHSAWMVAVVMMLAKSCDVGAYATGRLIGRHKLIPWLSPGKTWEGLAGGVALTAVLAVGLAAAANQWELGGRWVEADDERMLVIYPLWFAAVAGVLIGLLGQFGDLVASLFKRDAGIKDSGRSIPGFGGVLDVVDSPLAVAPLAYWLLELLRWMS